MTVKIGKEDVVTSVAEAPVEVKPETLEDKLRKIKKVLEGVHGQVAAFKLPNGKRLFVRAPSHAEYQIFTSKMEQIRFNAGREKPLAMATGGEVMEDLVKVCIINPPTGGEAIMAGQKDFEQYPACMGALYSKIEEFAGGTVTEDFLD